LNKDQIALEENWKWDDEWAIDINRAVDNEGWEYCIEPSMGGWCPSEKIYHLNRRRRWMRNRSVLTQKELQISVKVMLAFNLINF
jgi:myoferlin